VFSRQKTSSVHRGRLDCGHVWISNEEVVVWIFDDEPKGVCIDCASKISSSLSTNQVVNDTKHD
jgi:hypothetical protein